MSMHNSSKRGASRALRLSLLFLVPTAALVASLWWRDPALAKAEIRLDEGAADVALAEADVVLARRPRNERALSLKARALVELGRWDEAIHIFSQISVQSSKDMRACAIALVHRQRWNEALPLLEKLLEQDPDDPLALRHATTCQFQTGQATAALDSAAKLAKIRGHEVEGLFLSGVIHRAQENIELAVKNWAHIESLQPDAKGLPIEPAEFFLIYGDDLVSEGLPQTALAKLEKSRELKENLAVLLRLGKVWALTGNEAEALAAWKQALEYDAGNQEARNGLAELALGRSDAEEALQWQTPIASSPNISSTTAYLMERAHTLLGNEEELEYWQHRTAELRQSERRQAALQRRFRRG